MVKKSFDEFMESDFVKNYGKLMKQEISKNEEQKATFDKLTKESGKPVSFFSQKKQYHIELYLTKPEVIKILNALEPSEGGNSG